MNTYSFYATAALSACLLACPVACGGKTQEPYGADTCTTTWTKDQSLVAGKKDNAGQVAGSVTTLDGSLIVLINKGLNSGCRVMESMHGQWAEAQLPQLTQCLQASAGTDGYVDILAGDGKDSYVLLEKQSGSSWVSHALPNGLVPVASIHDAHGTHVLGVTSLLSLDGNGDNTRIYTLSESGWEQDAVAFKDAHKLSAFGFLNHKLVALGGSPDANGIQSALVLTRENGVWQAMPAPKSNASLQALISRDNEALTLALLQSGQTTTFYSKDFGLTWTELSSQGAKTRTGFILQSGILLAGTPQTENGGLWINGSEPVQFTRIAEDGSIHTSLPDNMFGIPLNVDQTEQGFALVTTQGVYYSSCR